MDSQESKDDKDQMENIDQGELQQRDSHNGSIQIILNETDFR